MSAAPPFEGILTLAKQQIEKVASFDGSTPKETLVEAQRFIYSYMATLSQFVYLDPRVSPVIHELNESNTRIYGLLGRDRSTNNVNLSDIDFTNKRKLGEGGYRCVYAATYRGEPVAVKLLKIAGGEDDDGSIDKDRVEMQKKLFALECGCLADVKHENTMILKGIIPNASSLNGIDGNRVFISGFVTELMATDLLHELKKETVGITERFKYCFEAARGLSYLHDVENMIHRDIKPENILIDSNGVAKIADFGIAQHLNSNGKTKDGDEFTGSLEYIAPEIWEKKELTNKVDIFSFAIVLQEVFSLTRYRKKRHSPKLYDGSTSTYYVAGGRYDLDHLPDMLKGCGLKELIRDCWDADPSKRPSMREVYERLVECYVRYFTPVELVTEAGLKDFSDEIYKFWKTLSCAPGYPLKVVSKWFGDKICEAVSSEDDRKKILEFLSEGNFVTLEKFIRSVQWFGLWFLPGFSHCLKDLTDLLGQNCFKGFMSNEESTLILGGKPDFTFIIRGSKTLRLKEKVSPQTTPFTISVSCPNQESAFNVINVRISRLSFDDVEDRYSFTVGETEGNRKNIVEVIQFLVPIGYSPLDECAKPSAYGVF